MHRSNVKLIIQRIKNILSKTRNSDVYNMINNSTKVMRLKLITDGIIGKNRIVVGVTMRRKRKNN